MTIAFAPSTAFAPATTTTQRAICSFDGFRKSPQVAPAAPVDQPEYALSMRCRRDLKKEKQLRNQQFARVHRKRVVKHFNRRAAQEAISNEDNDYLSSIYGTIRFRSEKDQK